MASQNWPIPQNRSDGFGVDGRIVSPSNNDLDPVTKSVVMLQEGDITIIPMNGTVPLPFVGVPAGFIVPYIVRRVTACSSQCATID